MYKWHTNAYYSYYNWIGQLKSSRQTNVKYIFGKILLVIEHSIRTYVSLLQRWYTFYSIFIITLQEFTNCWVIGCHEENLNMYYIMFKAATHGVKGYNSYAPTENVCNRQKKPHSVYNLNQHQQPSRYSHVRLSVPMRTKIIHRDYQI